MTSCSAEPLDERKQIILKAIVHDYTSTAEPVSSEMLAYRYRLGVKPATIRNEMAEMSELGYLRQPHTSAGRVPSDQGYRFYVDRLMSGPGLNSEEEGSVAESFNNASRQIDHILHMACRTLAALTHNASVATEPLASNPSLRYIQISRLTPSKLLLAMVVSDGRVEHSILELPNSVTQRQVTILSNIISEQFCGWDLDNLLAANMDFAPAKASGMLNEYKIITKTLRGLIRQVCYSDVYLEGASYVVSQPEFRDVHKLEALIEVFDRRTALFETLRDAMAEAGAPIVIGNENPYTEMRDCSFVTATYRIGNRTCGAIGVVGPTRMNYRRAVDAVNLLAQSLSRLLTSISVE
jgi:heat-inducible transcriptional repressor